VEYKRVLHRGLKVESDCLQDSLPGAAVDTQARAVAAKDSRKKSLIMAVIKVCSTALSAIQLLMDASFWSEVEVTSEFW
jgi:hypothetical protein